MSSAPVQKVRQVDMLHVEFMYDPPFITYECRTQIHDANLGLLNVWVGR